MRAGLLTGFLITLLCSCAVAFAQPEQNDDQLRVQVLQAISQGQKALIRTQQRNGSWSSSLYGSNQVGLTSLATLALLNSGLPADDDVIRRAVIWLKSAENDPLATYDISLAIMALVASGDVTVKGKVSRLADRLESFQHRAGDSPGTWGYRAEDNGFDNSNTQFAILGLHDAYFAGVPISRETWQRTQDHFIKIQGGPVDAPGGAGWGYHTGQNATGSMTVAGIASLSMTSAALQNDRDVLPDGSIDCCGGDADPAQPAIDAGVRWLSRHFRVRSNPGADQWPLYYLYGLERAGRFTGQRFFGEHDWYREGAEFLVAGQSVREGVWISRQEDEVAGTSLALLFLSKGLSPVVINKLKFGERNPQTGDVIGRDWNLHERDVSNLVAYTSSLPKWPKLLSWQVVDLRTAADGEGVSALLQSPIQFMSGSLRPESIQGRELAMLREYFTQGGFLLAVQNCEGDGFDAGFRDLVHRLFDGQQELQKLLPTHDVYRSEYLFPPDGQVPELWGVDFGCRTAIIYAPYDHACRWNKWMKFDPPDRLINVKTQIDKSMKLGVNVIAYATGRELADKLQQRQVPATADQDALSRGAVQIARLRHTGGWDTAPNALRRLQSALKSVNIEMASDTPTLAASDPSLFEYPLVYIHGRKNFQLNTEERQGLKAYLENGGFMLADACCGAQQFDASFRAVVEQIFGRKLERVPPEDEIFNLPLGYDIRKVRRRIPSDDPNRSSLSIQESEGLPVLEGIKMGEKYVIVYSKYDLSCALERQSTSACAGYPTEDAVKIGVNLVLYGLLQ